MSRCSNFCRRATSSVWWQVPVHRPSRWVAPSRSIHIVRFDHELRITYVNPAVERMTGRPADSLLGKTSRGMGIPEPVVSTWELVLRQVLRTGREQLTEYSLMTPGGERIFQSRIVAEN